MANTLKFGAGNWATKKGSTLAYNDENSNYKPLPFNFTRASSATRVNKDGLIETVGSGQPRIDYKDDSKGALKLEPQSTNLVTYSEDFSQWNNTDITIGANGASPSGETNANLIQTGSAGSDQVNETFTISATNTATYSVFIKRVSGAEWVDFLVVKAGFSNSLKVWFNIKDGLVGSYLENGTTTFDNASVKDFGNGWYRLQVTTTDTTNNTVFNIRVRTASADNSDTRFNNSSYYLWGAQLEQQSFSTSYILTQGSAVTRVADACNNSGNDQVINSTEGVLYLEMSALGNDGTFRYISLINDASNLVQIYYKDSSNRISAIVKSSGSTQFFVNHDLSDATNFIKVAIKYKQNDFALWVDGVEVATDTSGNTPSGLSELDFDFLGGNKFSGNVRDVKVYNNALTDSELQALTS